MDPTMQQGQMQGGQQGQIQGASPFTTADGIQLQRLQQAMSQAQQSLDDGEIEEQDFQGLAQQIQKRMAPLQQRQEQQKQQAEQEQEKAVMKQSALMESMQQQNAMMRKDGFVDRLVTVVDPLRPTRQARMFETSPNNWEKLEYDPDPLDEEVDDAEPGE